MQLITVTEGHDPKSYEPFYDLTIRVGQLTAYELKTLYKDGDWLQEMKTLLGIRMHEILTKEVDEKLKESLHLAE